MRQALDIVRIAGDGVGPELVQAGTSVIEALGLEVHWIDMMAGMAAYQQTGTTAPAATIEALQTYRLAIKGPFYTPNGGTIRSGNHYIRRMLDLYACLRPLPIVPGRPPVLLVRENLEDLYGAIEWMAAPDVAQAVKISTRGGCERITRYAFDLARKEGRARVTLVHKANNLKLTEGLFLDVARAVAAGYPDIDFDDMLADTAASSLVLDPGGFDVIVTSHSIGDILSNLGAALAGSLGLVGSLDSSGEVHVAEASHGAAEELAGQGRVNPLAFLRGISLLLRAIGRDAEFDRLTRSLDEAARHGPRTVDLGGQARLADVIAHICQAVRARGPDEAT